MRPAIGKPVLIRQLEFIESSGIDNQELAEIVCKLWMHYQPMNFYRITDVEGKILFFYDREHKVGLYLNRKKGIETEIKALPTYIITILNSQIQKFKEISLQAMDKIEVNDFSLI